MKKHILLISLALGLVMLFNQRSSAQCSAINYKNQNISKLANGFKYIHTFELDKGQVNSKGEMEFTYIFNKGTLYMMNMSNGEGQEKNIIIELYSQDKKLVATNYDSRTGKFWPIGYACNQSGVHYLKIRFKDYDKKCGIVVLGERK